MPPWLREAPPLDLSTAEQRGEPAQLGPRADPRTFLTDDDFPRWLRDLSLREPWHTQAEQAAIPTQSAAPADRARLAAASSHWQASAATSPDLLVAAPSADSAPALEMPSPSAP